MTSMPSSRLISAASVNRSMVPLDRMEMTSWQPSFQPSPATGGAAALVQKRHFDSRRKQKKRKVRNPFKVLRIKRGMKYKEVKGKFLKIAMQNHPDTSSTEDEAEQDKMREVFIAARIAFESLVEGDDGIAILKSEKEKDEDSLSNFDSWFKNETGHETPFHMDLDPETMKEVASMTDNMAVGLDRDGGMWTLAKMVTSAVKTGGDSSAMLRLDAGEVKETNSSSVVRRRRRRF
eukprot:CAMPEP_0198118220 /NCGR_PEP_ID=MMETSP1442-20131203/20800_1 /TAXON_ID= /ORGANISM="Craspedostauros australis, Strain CCMP3328" /LENGTH=233 /DNA_ID=CAMNT_0043776441 /DNA_START=242 /DNA_END=943 /DNA_ORIENTATION=+